MTSVTERLGYGTVPVRISYRAGRLIESLLDYRKRVVKVEILYT